MYSCEQLKLNFTVELRAPVQIGAVKLSCIQSTGAEVSVLPLLFVIGEEWFSGVVNFFTLLTCHMCIDGFQWSENPQAKVSGTGGSKSELSCMGMLSA